jgi:antirestriction protein
MPTAPQDFRNADVIDSRDLIAALADLESADEERELIAAIRELAREGIEDWEYGAQLIAEHYFEDYARELAEDIGALPRDYTWPTSCIDWEQAARELQMDYTPVEFLGTTYYVR